MAEVATCERRVYLKAKYGERVTDEQAQAKKRGDLVHEMAYRERSADGRGEDKRCFVATCVYGQDARETQVLRQFRDEVLSRSMVGVWATQAYYRTSPWLVRRLEGWKAGRQIAKAILDGVVGRVERGMRQGRGS